MRKLLSIFLMLLCISFGATAYDFSIDNLSYNINSNDTSVTVFANNKSISGEIIIPEIVSYNDNDYTVTIIGECAFYECNNITYVEIPTTVIYIEDCAFQNCIGLTSISIPNSIVSIGESAFNGCSSLISLTIPSSVSNILDYAFANCTSLNILNFESPSSLTIIKMGVFYNCTGLTALNLPNSITKIRQFAFQHCSGLSYINIPSSVKEISYWAFSYCTGLMTLIIPNSIQFIDEHCFNDCIALRSIYSKIIDPQKVSYGAQIFTRVDTNNCNLYVPAGTLELYKNTEPWSGFTNIFELSENNENPTIKGDVNGDGSVNAADVTLIYNIILGNE